jgi:hypothetical protein
VVVSGAVAAAFAPRAEVVRDAQLVVPPVSAPELEQVLPRAAHCVAQGALQAPVCPPDDSVAVHSAASPAGPLDALPEQVVPTVVRSGVSPGDLTACLLDDSVAVHSAASLVDLLDALPEQVVSSVVRSGASPGDLTAGLLDGSVAVHSAASLADLLDALPEQVAPLVVHSVSLQGVRLDALLADPQAGPLADYLAVQLEDDHCS